MLTFNKDLKNKRKTAGLRKSRSIQCKKETMIKMELTSRYLNNSVLVGKNKTTSVERNVTFKIC